MKPAPQPQEETKKEVIKKEVEESPMPKKLDLAQVESEASTAAKKINEGDQSPSRKRKITKDTKFIRVDNFKPCDPGYVYFEPAPLESIHDSTLEACLAHFTKTEELRDKKNLYLCE